jgi:hypothetical protein
MPRAVWVYSRMKKIEAPLVWIIRVTQPVLKSCMIFTILGKAVIVSAEYIMDKMIPVISCRDRVIPRRNPTFQRNEIEVGEGRSRSEVLIIFSRGFDLVSFFFIRTLRL